MMMMACKDKAEQRACEKMKYNQVKDQWRVEVQRCRAEEQAKKCVSCFWLIMTELMVVGRGGYCTTVQQRQKKGIRATRVSAVSGPWG